MSRCKSQFSCFTWLTLLSLLLCTVVVHAAENYYKTLGISKNASSKEVKKAYRSLSLEYHPDKNKDEGATDKFQEIARAYEVLSDSEKKQIYDQRGEEGLKQHEAQAAGGGGHEDMFSQFFGGGRQRQQREMQTPSVKIPLALSLTQLYKGETIEVEYDRQVLCMHWEMCMKAAPDCHGPGLRMVRQQLAPGFIQQFEQPDPRCVAQGKTWKENCKACPNKTETERISLTIAVQAGMRHGEFITFDAVADEMPGHSSGDLMFEIQEQRHDYFHRDRDDLYKTIEIPLVDALTGFKVDLVHLDDHEFTVTVTEVTECDHVLKVPGKGMPRRNGRGFGDLYITFDVDFPDTLSEQQKKAIREILEEDNAHSGEL
jgi:DnaJ-class molecular chaperone